MTLNWYSSKGKLSISAPSPQYLVIGRPGHLKCTGEGKGIHITEYKWRVNKTKIDSENVAQNGYLTFKKVAESDEGNYTCIVETVLQDVRKTIIVKTVEVSGIYYLEMTEYLDIDCRLKYAPYVQYVWMVAILA